MTISPSVKLCSDFCRPFGKSRIAAHSESLEFVRRRPVSGGVHFQLIRDALDIREFYCGPTEKVRHA